MPGIKGGMIHRHTFKSAQPSALGNKHTFTIPFSSPICGYCETLDQLWFYCYFMTLSQYLACHCIIQNISKIKILQTGLNA